MTVDPTEKSIIDLAQKYSKRFTKKLFKDFLLGRYSHEIRQAYWYRAKGFGILKKWNPDDVQEAIRVLQRGL
jgi:hypothetical protein